MSQPSTWNDVRKIADELDLKMHLAGMDLRDRWSALQPRLAKLERTIGRKGERIGKLLADELSVIGQTLRELRDEVVALRDGPPPPESPDARGTPTPPDEQC